MNKCECGNEISNEEFRFFALCSNCRLIEAKKYTEYEDIPEGYHLVDTIDGPELRRNYKK